MKFPFSLIAHLYRKSKAVVIAWCWASHHRAIQINPEFIFLSLCFSPHFHFRVRCWRDIRWCYICCSGCLHTRARSLARPRITLHCTFTIGNFSLWVWTAHFPAFQFYCGSYACVYVRRQKRASKRANERGCECWCVVIVVVSPRHFFFIFW